MTEQKVVGISKTTFILGLIIIFIINITSSYIIFTAITNPPEKADVKGFIIWNYEDKVHFINGFIVNLGTEPAYNVEVKLFWIFLEVNYTDTFYFSLVRGHELRKIRAKYDFEDRVSRFYYEIMWT